MNRVYIRILALSFAFSLTACDNKSPTSVKKAEKTVQTGKTAIESSQALKLDVNEAILKSLKMSKDEPISIVDSVELKIRSVKDQQRLSVNGSVLLQDTWQADYLDNIDGGKLELQLRFND